MPRSGEPQRVRTCLDLLLVSHWLTSLRVREGVVRITSAPFFKIFFVRNYYGCFDRTEQTFSNLANFNMYRHQLTDFPCWAKLGILGIEICTSESCQIWKRLWWSKPVAAKAQPWHLMGKFLLFAILAGKTMRHTKLPLVALESLCSSGAYFNFYFWDVYSVFNFGFVLSKPVFLILALLHHTALLMVII